MWPSIVRRQCLRRVVCDNQLICQPYRRPRRHALPSSGTGGTGFSPLVSEKIGRYFAWRGFPTSTGPKIYKTLEKARAPRLVRGGAFPQNAPIPGMQHLGQCRGKSAPRAEKAHHVRKRRTFFRKYVRKRRYIAHHSPSRKWENKPTGTRKPRTSRADISRCARATGRLSASKFWKYEL